MKKERGNEKVQGKRGLRKPLPDVRHGDIKRNNKKQMRRPTRSGRKKRKGKR